MAGVVVNLLNNTVTIVTVALSILQAPLIYYYTSGLLFLLYFPPYLFVALALTVWLFIPMKQGKSKNIRFQRFGLRVAILIGSFTLLFGDVIVERLDWEFRQDMRNEIVRLVKEDKLKPNVMHNKIICTLPDWNFPPISNGGNEIAIYKRMKENAVLVEFFINRGFLDHYSAFVYTDDPVAIREFDEMICAKNDTREVKKLDENWYRVTY